MSSETGRGGLHVCWGRNDHVIQNVKCESEDAIRAAVVCVASFQSEKIKDASCSARGDGNHKPVTCH